MGSLVPGWDADLGVPKELASDADILNIEKEPEPEGYFARLKSHRLSHGGTDDSVLASLARSSAPLSRSPTWQVARTSTGPLARTSTGPRTPPQHPFRSTSLSQSVAHHPETNGSARHKLPHHEPPTKYPFTDWSEELTTLRQGPPRHVSQVAHDEKHGGHCPEEIVGHEKRGAAWWRALEVGHLNEATEAVEAEAEAAQAGGAHHGTFVAQFTHRHDLDYGDAAGAGAGAGRHGGGEGEGEARQGA